MNFPSRKLFFFFIPVILVLGLFVLFKDTIIKKNTAPSTGAEVVAVKNSVINEVDSDGDGLKDWEEVLWGTDPLKKISNPEKIPDADYVQKKIDAKESIPTAQNNDSLTLKALATPGEDATDALSKDVFSEYISLKKSGNLNPTSIDQLAERITSNIALPANAEFKEANLKTFDDKDSAMVRVYGNTFALIEKKYRDQYELDPIQSEDLSTGLTSANPSSIQKIDRASKMYSDMAHELMTLSVPKSLASIHTDLANNYMQSSQGLKNMELLQKDPTRAIIGIEQHTKASSEEPLLLTKIINFFGTNGIIFTAGEPGFSLNTLQ